MDFIAIKLILRRKNGEKRRRTGKNKEETEKKDEVNDSDPDPIQNVVVHVFRFLPWGTVFKVRGRSTA